MGDRVRPSRNEREESRAQRRWPHRIWVCVCVGEGLDSGADCMAGIKTVCASLLETFGSEVGFPKRTVSEAYGSLLIRPPRRLGGKLEPTEA